MMKKVLGITASTLIVAGAFSAPVQAEDVFSRLSVRATAHYDQATNERALFARRATTVAGAAGETFFVEPDYEFDYAFGLEYMLPNSDNSSLLFDYDHYNNNKNGSQSRGINTHNSVIDGALLPVAGSSTGELRLKDNNFRLGARRALDFGDRFDMQLGAYAEYAKVERHQVILETSGPDFKQLTLDNEAKGWGPSFDMMGRWYPMGRHSCFSFLAGVEAAFLYGDSSFQARSTNQVGLVVDEFNNSNRADLNHVFTRLGSTLAFSYARPVNDAWKLGLRVGGRWLNYTNAFKNSGSLSDGRTDYGRWGPFLEVRMGGIDSPM